MHVSRIGLTPLKGARHAERPSLRLEATGPVGDRLFCLVDVDRARVLRTIDVPSLIAVDAAWDGAELRIRTPEGREVLAPPRPTGRHLVLDYWGRDARLEVLESPHAQLLAEYLGRDVRLTRVSRPGEVVYGGAVSLVCTGELTELGEEESVRFRATFTLEATRLPDPGSELGLGEAVVRLRRPIPRCRVIDINPVTGAKDRDHLATLASRPRPARELWFGVDAEVVVPGTVRTGDAVTGQPRRH